MTTKIIGTIDDGEFKPITMTAYAADGDDTYVTVANCTDEQYLAYQEAQPLPAWTSDEIAVANANAAYHDYGLDERMQADLDATQDAAANRYGY